MKGSGNRIKLMDLASFGILMVMFMKANGKMTKRMDKAFTCTQMELGTKGLGKTTNNMVMVLNSGLMAVSMRVTIKME